MHIESIHRYASFSNRYACSRASWQFCRTCHQSELLCRVVRPKYRRSRCTSGPDRLATSKCKMMALSLGLPQVSLSIDVCILLGLQEECAGKAAVMYSLLHSVESRYILVCLPDQRERHWWLPSPSFWRPSCGAQTNNHRSHRRPSMGLVMDAPRLHRCTQPPQRSWLRPKVAHSTSPASRPPTVLR